MQLVHCCTTSFLEGQADSHLRGGALPAGLLCGSGRVGELEYFRAKIVLALHQELASYYLCESYSKIR
jgi:hypothetical protein